MKKRTSSMSRRIVSLLMSMVLTLTLVTPAAFAEGMGAYANGEGTAVTTPADIATQEGEDTSVSVAQRTVTVKQYHANEAYEVKIVVGVEEGVEKLDTTYTIDADTKTVTLKLTTDGYDGEPVYIKTALDDVLVTEGENQTPALTKDTPELEYALPEDGDVTLYYGTQEDFNAPATQRTVTVEQYRANEAYDVKLVVGVEEAGTTEKLDTTYAIDADTKTVTLKLTTDGYEGEPIYIKTALDDVLVTEDDNKTPKTPALTKDTTTLEYPLPEEGDVPLYYGTQEDFVSAWYGDGTATDYYIRTAEELAYLAQLVNGTAKDSAGKKITHSFKGEFVTLAQDIDLSAVCGEQIGDWTPIGSSASKSFQGTFDGRGYTVKELYINESVSKNTLNYSALKGLFGCSKGAVQNLIVTGSVTVTNSKKANVTQTAGIVGRNWGGTVSNCGFYGAIKATNNSGDCINKNGGVVGDGTDSVSNCWFYSVDAESKLAVCAAPVNCIKLTATEKMDTEKLATLNTEIPETGKLWGWNEGDLYPELIDPPKTITVKPLFSDRKDTVSIKVDGDDRKLDENGTYDVGKDTAAVTISLSGSDDTLYYATSENEKAYGIDNSGEGKLTPITEGYSGKLPVTLYYGTEDDFNTLAVWNSALSKDGKSATIKDADTFRAFARMVNRGKDTMQGKTILLGVDIDLSPAAPSEGEAAAAPTAWTPIGTELHPFGGTFSAYSSVTRGNYKISGLNVDDADNAGLFGVVDGTIQYVTIDGTVMGRGNVGSLVGWLRPGGRVYNSMSNAAASGSADSAAVGGLVGLNQGTVSSCYYYNVKYVGMPAVGKTEGETANIDRCFYLAEDGKSTFGDKDDTGARTKLEFEVGRVTHELQKNNDTWACIPETDTGYKFPQVGTNGFSYMQSVYLMTLTPEKQELPDGVTAEIKMSGTSVVSVLINGDTQYAYVAGSNTTVKLEVVRISDGYNVAFNPSSRNNTYASIPLYADNDKCYPVTYSLSAGDTSWYNKDSDEFILTTENQLRGLAALVNGWAGETVSFKDKTIKLGNDIELTGTWTPIGIGTNVHFFEGTFDGQEYTISDLRVETAGTYAGLFGYVRYGTIKNLTVEGSVRSTTGNDGANTGGIVGYLYQGTVENCTNKTEVTAVMGGVGGVAGHAYEGNGECRIEKCSNTATVTATGNGVNGAAVGGIVGSTGDKVIVRLCENTGNVTASGTKNVSASGIGGWRVLNSHNSGRVEIASGTADYLYAGGITARGTVDSCQNDGAVCINAKWSSQNFCYAGGIAAGGVVTNSYNTGAVANNFAYADGAAKLQIGVAAGIAASPTSSIFNCYNTGDVSSTEGVAYGLGGVGTDIYPSKTENSYYVCKVSNEELMKYVSAAGVERDVTIKADKVYMVDAELLVDLLNKNCSGGTPWFVDEAKNNGLPMLILSWDGKNMDASKKIVYVTYESGAGIYRTTGGLPRKDMLTLEKDVSGEFQPVSYTVLGVRAAGVAHKNGDFRVWMADDGNEYAGNSVISVSDDITLTAQWDEIWVGSGTAADPYQIPDGEKLAALAEQVNEAGFDYAGEWFRLTKDIDLSNFANWTPIGNGATISGPWFSGNLDGNGKSISGLVINSSNSVVGLFGRAKGGTFKDFKLSGTVTGSGYSGVAYVGSLIGHGGGVALDSIEADVTVAGGGQTGGLVGYDLFRADRCVVHGSVTGNRIVGGISTNTSNNSLQINDCHNYATITSTGSGSRCSAAGIWACYTDSATGRFTGCTNNGTIKANTCAAGIATAGFATGCINYGSVTSTNFVAAGISNNGNAVKCGNTGTIIGYGDVTTMVGGVAGITNFDKGASFCYNTGNVICTYNKNWAYGIAAGGAISNSFSYVTGKDIALAPNTLAEGKVINSYYLASKKDAVSSAGEYATQADFASGKVAWGVDGGTGAHKNYWTQDTQRGNNQMPVGPGRAYPKPIEDPNTEFSVYRALVQCGVGGTASLAANGHSSENQENAVYGMKGTNVTVTATPKDDTFGLKSLTLDLMGTGSTTALESGDSFTLGEANALVVAAFASTGNGGSGDGTGGNGGDGDGTGTDTGDGAGDENDEGLQDGLNLEVEYDVKGLVLSAYGAWGAEGSGKTFTQWLKDSPEVLRALITNSLDNMAVAAMGKKTDEAKDLAALLLASLNEHSGLDGQSSDTIGKMLRKYIESGTEAAFSAWLTTGGGMASGTYESIFAQYTNSLLALADRLYTNWESSGTSLTFPQWLDAQQVTMESLSEIAEEPDAEPDDTQTTEAPEEVPDGQESEGGASGGGNSVWEVIGTVVRENPIIVWTIVAVVAALIIVGAVRRYHKVKRDEHDDVTSKK